MDHRGLRAALVLGVPVVQLKIIIPLFPMRMLITGGAGFIGSHVVDLLVDED